MTNNSALQKIQYALRLTHEDLERIFKLIGFEITEAQIKGYFMDQKHEDFLPCPPIALSAFLEGLILEKRGVNEKSPTPPVPSNTPLNNNDIFKKLRVAMDFHGEDIAVVLDRANATVHPHDLSAYFRKDGHKHYKNCPDAILESFLLGIRLCRRK